jgi:hypothetical protein
VSQYHDLLQQRRREQQSVQFKERMHQRNAIEGTVSELARAHGLRRSRYRGFAKVELQNLFIATACNIKRWLRAIVQSFSCSSPVKNYSADAIFGILASSAKVGATFLPTTFFATKAQ